MLNKIYKSLKIIWRSLQIALALVWSRAEMYCVLSGKITGKSGTVKTGNAAYASATELKVIDWQFAFAGGTLDQTDSGSGDYRERVPGKRYTASGSFNAFHLYGATLLAINTQVEAHLVEDDTSTDEVYWSGPVIITGISLNTPVEAEDSVKIGYTWETAGAWVKTDSSAV